MFTTYQVKKTLWLMTLVEENYPLSLMNLEFVSIWLSFLTTIRFPGELTHRSNGTLTYILSQNLFFLFSWGQVFFFSFSSLRVDQVMDVYSTFSCFKKEFFIRNFLQPFPFGLNAASYQIQSINQRDASNR